MGGMYLRIIILNIETWKIMNCESEKKNIFVFVVIIFLSFLIINWQSFEKDQFISMENKCVIWWWLIELYADKIWHKSFFFFMYENDRTCNEFVTKSCLLTCRL